ncbi:MAG TPA: metallophosphoesterase family protein [Anaerolineae bacterium]|jgi:3',5'-cyclic AMP phosphodiesterase CpdA|nr:metallophosphoesterase family protein [Anaerolineae bacterium]
MIQKTDTFLIDDAFKPYTHLNFKNDPEEFQFAMITDNAGGAREGVFPKAVEMANLLQPEFIVNAGDLIEGYSDDEEQIRTWWQEVDEVLETLEMPFFFLPGNHDFYSEAAIKVWRERFGNDGGYYHFVYKNVLFLMVNTEDPPKTVEELQHDKPELFQRVAANYIVMAELQAKEHQTPEDGKKLLELGEPIEEWLGEINISEEQVAYFKEVLEANRDVRWTFCFTHAPPHYTPAPIKRDPGNFAKIEALLADRPYTVFSAHTHTYDYDQRDGHDYITTATSGAMNIVRPGAMDHLVWITMTKDGPKIANLLMNGIMDKKGPPKHDALEKIGLYKART